MDVCQQIKVPPKGDVNSRNAWVYKQPPVIMFNITTTLLPQNMNPLSELVQTVQDKYSLPQTNAWKQAKLNKLDKLVQRGAKAYEALWHSYADGITSESEQTALFNPQD